MELEAIKIQEQRSYRGKDFPLILAPKDGYTQNKQALLTWLSDNQAHLRQLMMEHGAVLLRNCPIDGPDDFEAVLDSAEFINMPYVGGAAPREEVTKGRILTANESPPDQPIPFHHEMAQVPKPPAYIFFYCDVASETGGETAIVHSGRVYERFSKSSPEFAKKVEELGVKYRRVMPDQDDHSSPIGRSWRSTFLTDDPAEAEEKMRSIGTSWNWQGDGNLYTETAIVPAIRTEERTGIKTFYNSVVAAYTGWVDERNDPKNAVVCGDDSPVDHAAVMEAHSAMQEECVAFKWQRGDVLLIDNSLVMHSRRPYTGARRILASIAVG
ncbi:MAG: TauD/TfdA family dioxygenase [Myxococcota bacterium]|nr:TauD/TfdA family dioxygenase [Myxococcota bacterium]